MIWNKNKNVTICQNPSKIVGICQKLSKNDQFFDLFRPLFDKKMKKITLILPSIFLWVTLALQAFVGYAPAQLSAVPVPGYPDCQCCPAHPDLQFRIHSFLSSLPFWVVKFCAETWICFQVLDFLEFWCQNWSYCLKRIIDCRILLTHFYSPLMYYSKLKMILSQYSLIFSRIQLF